jgi:hypothetical protein
LRSSAKPTAIHLPSGHLAGACRWGTEDHLSVPSPRSRPLAFLPTPCRACCSLMWMACAPGRSGARLTAWSSRRGPARRGRRAGPAACGHRGCTAVMSAGSRMARWAAGRGHPPGRAAVVLRQSWLPEDDVRPAGGGPDDPVPAAQRAAAGVTGADRDGAGGPGGRPPGGGGGHRGAPQHATRPGRGPVGTGDQHCAGGCPGRAISPCARGTSTGPCWSVSPRGR